MARRHALNVDIRGSSPCPGATALSSRGLGRRPLTAVTRVRIPLGLPSKALSYKDFCKLKSGAVAIWLPYAAGGRGSLVTMDDSPREHSKGFLAEAHARHAKESVRYADEYGAFAESVLEGLFGDAFPIVPDANILRGNIGRAYRDQHRTVLLTGAHSRSFRLYCARHVLDEVQEHSPRWASELGIPHQAYLDCWRDQFLPYVRLVNTSGLRGLLSPEEGARIDALKDRDDVPSATLALALGAFYLTEDAEARFAVYGVDADAPERRNWLAPLQCGGDAGELQKLERVAFALPAAAIAGGFSFGGWLYKKSPWILAGAMALGLFAAARVKRETYRALGRGLGEAASRFGEAVLWPYYENSERFRAMAPRIPSWETLLEANDRESVLARSCLCTLARRRKCPMTAGEIATALPRLGIGQNAQRIGRILRTHECFFEPYQRHWQVGRAVVRAPA
jgi:predicted nucleic acid-binding protein